MAETYDWPTTLPFASLRLDPIAISRSGGANLAGVEQITDSGATVWRMLATVRLGSDADVRAFRAIRSQARGRANRIRFDLGALTLTARPAGLSGLSGDQFLATAAADIGDTDIEVDDSGFTLTDLEGCWVSVGDGYLHEVAAVNAGTSTITLNPGLRVAIAVSDPVSVAPVFVARAASDDTLTLPIELDGYATMELTFIEAFDR